MKQASEKYGEGETIRLIGRGSKLSLLQLQIVKQKINNAFPGTDVQIITRDSRGDDLAEVPLQTVEGNDFFTRDIFDALANGEADIAVHSLKDMSSEHFFGSNKLAVVDRDDTRDVVVLNQMSKVKREKGETLVIGTCSPRREEMAIGFLQKALPYVNNSSPIETKTIRGNVDTRLRKLDSGEYDGIILATAGLNRLLKSQEHSLAMRKLLKNKIFVVLPLIECVPAPCQGAIVAEGSPLNKKAVEVLSAIDNTELMNACVHEKKTAQQYGIGCLQRFGVTTIHYGNQEVLYAAGKDSEGTVFTKWGGLPALQLEGHKLFSTADHLGSFFHYDYNNDELTITEPVIYVANYKAVQKKELIDQLKTKRVWAAGTKTWLELSKSDIWVEGSADAFGLEFLEQVLTMPLLDIPKSDIAVITNNEAAEIWRSKGWKAYGTYSTVEKCSADTEQQIKEADIIFWTSYRQYLQYKGAIKQNVTHVCAYGETAQQFKLAGIEPVIFPNIKAFQQWKQISTRSRSVA
jgi:hydroxymethylbilane synthase